MGVKSLAPLLVHVGAVLLATILSGRSHAASPGVIRARRLINLVVLLVGVAVLSRMFGALIMVPSLAASVAIPFGYHASRRERLLVVVPAALATVAVPMILEMIGILDPTYVTNAAGEIMIVSHVADLSSGLSIPSMLLASVSGLAIALVLIGQMADRLRAARRRLLVQRWQLRQFLPDEPGLPATVKREI